MLVLTLLLRDCDGQLSEWKLDEKSDPSALGALKLQDDMNDGQSSILSHSLVSIPLVRVARMLYYHR